MNGRLPLFRNFDEDGNRLACPRTLLIDSEQLDSCEALDKNCRAAAGNEIERFRRERIQRTGDCKEAEHLSDQDLLREVMNTVGKPDTLGGSTRCVVSVSMRTEGSDARTVTHEPRLVTAHPLRKRECWKNMIISCSRTMLPART